MYKTFLKRMLLFCAPVIVILIIGEIMVRSLPNAIKYKENWLKQNGNKVQTLILGSSATYYGINPSMIDSCFNAANASQGLEYDYYLLKRYINYCPNLKTIIIPVDFTNLFQQELETIDTERGRAIYYNIYQGYPKHSSFSRYSFEISNPTSFNQKIIKNLNSLIMNGSFNIDCDSLGWAITSPTGKEKSETMTLKAAKTIADRTKYSEKELNRNLGYLNGIVDLCDKNDYKLIMIVCPRYKYFLISVDEARKTKAHAILTSYIQRNCIIKDYSNEESIINNLDFFWDSNHLNSTGSKAFTNLLKKDFNL